MAHRSRDDDDDSDRGGDDSDNPLKRHRPSSEGEKGVLSRCLLSQKAVGSVIGPKGSIISYIREQHPQCRIEVTNASQTIADRAVSISGPLQLVCDAFVTVLSFTVSASTIPQDPNAVVSPVVDDAIVTTVRLLIPGGRAGGLIGKGGETIMRLRNRSGCGIDISREPTPTRTVVLSGSIAAILVAHEAILHEMSIVEERRSAAPREVDQRQRSDATLSGSEQLQLPSDVIGKVIGRGGDVIREIRHTSGASIDISKSAESGPFRLVSIVGSPQQRELAKYLMSVAMAGGSLAGAVRPMAPVQRGVASGGGGCGGGNSEQADMGRF